jgi:hypothetical protein
MLEIFPFVIAFAYDSGFAAFCILKLSKQLESTLDAVRSSGFGPHRLNFSIVWC